MKFFIILLLSISFCFVSAQSRIIQDDQFGAEFNPTGNPLGGGANYSDVFTHGDITIDNTYTAEMFRDAVEGATPGQVVFINNDVDLDLFPVYENRIKIKGGVTIAGGRDALTNSGGRIKVIVPDDTLPGHYIFEAIGDNVRISGLRIQGPFEDRGTQTRSRSGIISDGYSIEVDNCELYGFPEAAVYILNGDGNIHHNYFHHNQGEGLGYGVSISGGSALIEANVFDWGRHAIAAGSTPGISPNYEARYNIFLKNFYSYPVDVHGDLDENMHCTGDAGGSIIVHHNSFYTNKYQYPDPTNVHASPLIQGIGIFGVPSEGTYIFNNWFVHENKSLTVHQRIRDEECQLACSECDKSDSTKSHYFYYDSLGHDSLTNITLFQNKWGTGDWGTNVVNGDNSISEDRYRTGDFNGDGKLDILKISDSYQFCVQLYKSQGIGYDPIDCNWGGNGADIDLARYKIGDFNGDGLDDIISFEQNKNFYVWKSTGSSFSSTSKWSENGEDLYESYKLGDFNGDDKTDVMSIEVAEHPTLGSPSTIQRMHVWLANSTGTSFEKNNEPYYDWAKFGNSMPMARYKIGDFAGNHNSDLIEFHTNNNFYMWEADINGTSSIDPGSPVVWGCDGADRHWLYKVTNHDNILKEDLITFQNEKLYVLTASNTGHCNWNLWIDLNDNGDANGSQSGRMAPLSADHPEELLKTTFYPNPAKNEVTIMNDQGLATKIDILDLSGKKIKSILSDQKEIKLKVSELQPNLYIMKITNSATAETVKVIIK